MADLHLLLHAENGLLETDRQVEAQVIALAWSAAARTCLTATTAAEAGEEGFKQIGKTAHVAHIGHAATTAQPGFAELVVARPGLGIAQYFIGAANLLELVFSASFLVDIGVVLAR
jgi:hypothetical protein